MDSQVISSKRLDSIDLLKSLAICAVLLIHCSANRFALFETGSVPWLTTAFLGTVSRWAVPVFLMCSGALMNDSVRELPLKKLFLRYILRLVLVLSVWAGFYELLRIFIARGTAPLSVLLFQAVKNWCLGNTYYHLYYFYFALALYFALPLTRLIVRYASEAELRYILVLWFIAGGLIPFLQYFPPFHQMTSSLLYYRLSAAFLCPGLGLLGWYLRQHPPKGFLPPLVLFFVGFAVVFLGLWRRSVAVGNLDTLFLDAFNPFILLMAAAVFSVAQAIKLAPGATHVVRLLSRGSFCIYLIHPFFQLLTRQSFFESLPPLWSIPVQASLLLILSLGTYLVLRKIPLVSRWLI